MSIKALGHSFERLWIKSGPARLVSWLVLKLIFWTALIAVLAFGLWCLGTTILSFIIWQNLFYVPLAEWWEFFRVVLLAAAVFVFGVICQMWAEADW